MKAAAGYGQARTTAAPTPRVAQVHAYRPGQERAAAETIEGLRVGVRTVFLYAPVGSGKSYIYLRVAEALGAAYISTPQVTQRAECLSRLSNGESSTSVAQALKVLASTVRWIRR